MRFVKLSPIVVLTLAMLASAAFAGDSCHKDAAATGTAAAPATHTCPGSAGSTAAAATHSCAGAAGAAAHGCSGAMSANCSIETTRLPSGGLVVHYIGTTPEAIAALQAKAEGSVDKFCCHLKKASADEACKVDVTKVSNGVLVYVSSTKKEVLDGYEKDFAQMTATK